MDAHATSQSNAYIDSGVTGVTGVTGLTGPTVHAAIDLLVTCELARCGHRELDIVAGAAQRVRGFLAAADARIARRRDQLWHDDMARLDALGGGGSGDGVGGGSDGVDTPGGVDAGDTCGAGLGGHLADDVADEFAKLGDRRSGDESERDRNRARTGHAMPSFETALADGRIDIAHLDAVTASLDRLTDDQHARAEFLDHEEMLLGAATVEPPDRFRRRCTDLARRLSRDHGVRHTERQKQAAKLKHWWDRNGMWHFHAELDPETAGKVLLAFDHHLDTFRRSGQGVGLTWDRMQVESFLQLVTGSAALEPRSPEIIAIVDMATLLSGTLGPEGICETSGGQPLPPATIQRLACDANIIPVLLGPDRTPFDHGQTRRLASRRQRRALRLMYRTCAHPNCRVAFDRCRIHHIRWWENDGPTDLANLLPLCGFHHHQVHEGGWDLTMTTERATTWTTPNGTHWFTGDTRDRVAAAATPPQAPVTSSRSRIVHPRRNDDRDHHPAHVAAAGAAETQGRRPRRRQQPAASGNPNLFGHESVPAGP